MTPLIIGLYPMITRIPLVADDLPKKALIARQWPTNRHAHTYMHVYTRAHTRQGRL